jgi:hypothetical protein
MDHLVTKGWVIYLGWNSTWIEGTKCLWETQLKEHRIINRDKSSSAKPEEEWHIVRQL